MGLQVFIGVVGLLGLALTALYIARLRGRPLDVFDPKVSWTRAGIYFCTCFVVAFATGTTETILASPFVTDAQLADTGWWAFTLGCLAFILVAYWGVWPHYTVLLDRERELFSQTAYGVLWGMSQAQLFLTVWHVSGTLDWPVWGQWLLTWGVLGAYQPNMQSAFWDVYISPEHDTTKTMRIKALGAHIPNLTLCLTYLALWDNYLIFAGLQVLAFISASTGMRFPPPWAEPSRHNAPASAIVAGMRRATGYASDVEPADDPNLPFERG